jgi:hypothetical protein
MAAPFPGCFATVLLAGLLTSTGARAQPDSASAPASMAGSGTAEHLAPESQPSSSSSAPATEPQSGPSATATATASGPGEWPRRVGSVVGGLIGCLAGGCAGAAVLPTVVGVGAFALAPQACAIVLIFLSPIIPEIVQVLGTVGFCAGCGLCAPAACGLGGGAGGLVGGDGGRAVIIGAASSFLGVLGAALPMSAAFAALLVPIFNPRLFTGETANYVVLASVPLFLVSTVSGLIIALATSEVAALVWPESSS